MNDLGHQNCSASVVDRARHIRLVALDADGVLTDGTLSYGAHGEAWKCFHVQDGLGIQLLIDVGIEVAVITARASMALEQRVADLRIQHFRQNARDKLGALRALAKQLGLGLHQVCYVGDDMLDLPALSAVGLAVSVADAHPVAREAAHWITTHGGGRGAVRQLADLILEAQFGLANAYERRLALESRHSSGDGVEHTPFGVIIPARYASMRLPGKPLLDLGGKPMIVRVIENALRSGAAYVLVATDDQRIARVVEAAGHKVLMTSSEHTSGTDRLAEVVDHDGVPDDSIIVNVQGDEPLIEPTLIRVVAEALAQRPTVGIATAAVPIDVVADLFDPNVVKVTTNRDGLAICFTRAPVPWVRDAFRSPLPPASLPGATPFLRHVGLYAYRAGSLRKIARQSPVAVEQAESLEQLRAQWLGIAIHVTVVDASPGCGVDTAADLERVRALFQPNAEACPDDITPAEGIGT